MTDQLQLSLPNQKSAISGCQDQVEEFARRNRLPDAVLHDLQLALEEHLTNIVSYGHAEGKPHPIRICLQLDESSVRVEIADRGSPFNPLDHPPPDLHQPIEERPIGGLGIYMMRKAMDGMAYRRENGRNILVLTKRLPVT